MDKLSKGTKIRINCISDWVKEIKVNIQDNEIESSATASGTKHPIEVVLLEDIPILTDYSDKDIRLMYEYKGVKYISDKITNIRFDKDMSLSYKRKDTGEMVELLKIDLYTNMYCIETEEIKYYFEIV